MEGHSIFPLVRLLVPNCDRERPSYSIKEKTLANLFCEAAGLPPKSEGAIALTKFNNPQCVPAGLSSAVGDFPGVLEGILRTRGYSGGNLKLGDINQLLDDLAKCKDHKEKLAVIRRVYTTMSPTEIKW
jgi:DNA ligase-4